MKQLTEQQLTDLDNLRPTLEKMKQELDDTSMLAEVGKGALATAKSFVAVKLTRWAIGCITQQLPTLFHTAFIPYGLSRILRRAMIDDDDLTRTTIVNNRAPERLINRVTQKWNSFPGTLVLIRFPNGPWGILCDGTGGDAKFFPNSTFLVPRNHVPFWEKWSIERECKFGPRTTTEICAHISGNILSRGERVKGIRLLNELPMASSTRTAVEEYRDKLMSYWRSDNVDIRRKSLNLGLFGPAGTGKTSIAYALAREFTDTISVFPQAVMRSDFWALSHRYPKFSIILADEADKSALWKPPEKTEIYDSPLAVEKSPADISDVLAFLTGPRAPTSTATIVISNYEDKLDHRALREGRVWKRIQVGPVDSLGIRYYLENYHHLDVPSDYTFVEDKTTATILALEDKLDDPTLLMEALRSPITEKEK